MAQASPTGPSSTDPSQRRDFIEDQLAQHNELETLSANVSDDPQSFQALLDILNEDFNVVIRDLGERGNGPFSTTDLLNVANQLNNLPEHKRVRRSWLPTEISPSPRIFKTLTLRGSSSGTSRVKYSVPTARPSRATGALRGVCSVGKPS